jgi:adenine-specific DNA-methyltransferase
VKSVEDAGEKLYNPVLNSFCLNSFGSIMPTLNWIGKEAVVNHHNQVPFRLLKRNNDLSVGEQDSGNLLVQGDNLEALKALLPYYAGQVKCIYIDPPYNTGNENWVYNDNVNSPEMREWLGEVVGKHSEDLSRNDKWLCMMYPRVALLQKLLSPDGLIAVSIDDNEVFWCGLLMDDLFGPQNRLACAPWLAEPSGGKEKTGLRNGHEYVLIYHNGDSSSITQEEFSSGTLSLKDKWGKYRKGRELRKWGGTSLREDRLGQFYSLKTPDGIEVWPIRNDGKEGHWRWGKNQKMKSIIEDPEQAHWELRPFDEGVMWNGQHERWVPYEKIRNAKKSVGWSTWLDSVGFNSDATRELKEIFGHKPFDTPKPVSLLEWIISLNADDNALVLDSFGGSGTTAHAVMQLNAQDGGNRRFILVEMDKTVAENITAQRLTKVIQGYQSHVSKEKYIDGLGGGFSYVELGSTLFNLDGQINDGVSYNDLARHIYFCETGEPLPKTIKNKSPLLGIHKGIAIYLLYNGILKDKTVNGGNVLTSPLLTELPAHDGQKVIYGNACRLSEKRLRSEQIIFKQTPYEIRIS